MNLRTAISTCLTKYATFKGRASRSEYWWFYLSATLMSWAGSVVDAFLDNGGVIASLVSLAMIIPWLAAGCRRLHDIGRSGWWQLLYLTVIGSILIFVWQVSKGQDQLNEYGEPVTSI